MTSKSSGSARVPGKGPRAGSGWNSSTASLCPAALAIGASRQDRCRQLCPHAQDPLSWPLPRHAGALHRVCARRVWKRRTQQHRIQHQYRDPVIDLMPEQRDIADMGGTMRLGIYPCQLQPGYTGGRRLCRRGLPRRGQRAPPPPVRIQQCISGRVGGARPRIQRALARRPPG